jgi:hypothetical protein
MMSRSNGEGVKVFCDNSTKASVIKSVTRGGGGQKNVQYCMTSLWTTPYLNSVLMMKLAEDLKVVHHGFEVVDV